MVHVNRVEAPKDSVNPDFYRGYYADMAEKTDEEVLLHWLKHGQVEGRLPNEAAADEKFRNHPALPEDFDLQGYLNENDDIAQSIRWKFQAIEHFLRTGMSENRRYKPKPPEPEKPKPAPPSIADIVVDVEFYRIVYPDMKGASESKCQEHYFKFGRREGRFPDFKSYLEAHPNRERMPHDFSIAAYIAKAPDLWSKFEHPWQYIIHFLNSGLDEKRDAHADHVSPRFIKDYYDYSIPPNHPPHQALHDIAEARGLDRVDLIFLNAQELCSYHGVFSKKFLKIFDHEAYIFGNNRDEDAHENIDIDPGNYALCLEHFLTHGIHHGHDVSYTYFFDPLFYVGEYKSALPRALIGNIDTSSREAVQGLKVDLFKHWLTSGLGHKMVPNLIIWAEQNLEFQVPRRITNDLDTYLRLGPDLEDMDTPSKQFAHFTKHGLCEHRPGVVFNDETASFFSDAAEALMIKGKRAEAVKIYNYILQSTKSFPKAAHSLGDDLLRHGFHTSALELYTQLIDNQTASQWSYINASACHDALADDINAVRTLIKGAQAYPEDVNMAVRAQKAIAHFFPKILKRTRNTAITENIPQARDMIRDALTLFKDDQFAPLRDTPIKNVVIVGNHDLPQCRFYRIDQKVDHLEKAGYHVTVYRHTENLDAYHARLSEADAVIFYRVPALPPIIGAINAANIMGLPTFYDMDDLLFDETLFPPPLSTYAGQISADQHASMAADVPLVRHAMSLCRFGIASTTALAKEMENVVHSGRVFHHKNAFGALHESMAVSPVEKQKSAPLTIFYGSGTRAHKDDFHTIIEPVFLRLHERFGEAIRFVVLGHISLTPALESLGDSLEMMAPIWDTEDYWSLMRDRADINLSVLSSTRVTDAKSEIKWLEAAMFGIPSVVSKTATHAQVIEHGETGYLCESADAFFDAIAAMVEDANLRQKIGTAAREAAFKHYSIAAMADNISQILSSFERPTHKPAKKKIAIVNVFYPPQAVGGATRVVHDNVNDLIDEFGDTFDVCVFTTRNGEKPYELVDYVQDGVRVSAISTESTPNLEQRMVDPQMAVAFRRFLDREKPDLVHFHCVQRLTTSVLSETRIQNIPYVITAHDGWWISDSQFLVDEHDAINLYTYKDNFGEPPQHMGERQRAIRKDIMGARHILAVSDQFADIYRKTGLDHTITIENGVSQLPDTQRIASQSGRVRLAHIGGVSRHKGFHLVKHALMSRPDFTNLELLVVDHASQKGAVAREVWGSTPVTIVPKVPQSEIANLFSTIDVLLAPSIWPESFGLVTREALMCGCRVIASDRGAVGACIDHGENGLIVSVDTIDGVRDALAEVNANHDFYLTPPAAKPVLRPARQQARDLAALYTRLLAE